MIEKICLKNFRQFSYKEFNVSNNLVIFKGQNATGKTTILEAIYLASTTKSHRTNNYVEMIKDGTLNSQILVKDSYKYQVSLDNKKKHFYINNNEYRNIDYINNLKVVMFSPYDLKIVNSTVASFRKFIDSYITLFSPSYLQKNINYKKTLKKRNEVLKYNIDLKLINSLTSILVNYVTDINLIRDNFLKKLNSILKEICQELNFEIVSIKYNLLLNKEDILKKYNDNLKVDIKYKTTNYGPHRDNFTIYLDEYEAKTYASQGQLRFIAICLKLAIIKMLELKKIDAILLLDDVFAELDNKRQEAIVKYIGNNQTFITTTSLIEIPNELLKNALIIELKAEKGR